MQDHAKFLTLCKRATLVALSEKLKLAASNAGGDKTEPGSPVAHGR
jgi:hypothetical protein